MVHAQIIVCFLMLMSSQERSAHGIIRGTVTSESSGMHIANASVVLEETQYKTSTDSNGVYRLSGIPDGRYNLRVSAPGYGRFKFWELTITHALPIVIDVKLKEGGRESDVSVIVKFSELGESHGSMHDKMKFYQPDSSIDYKIRIYNPEQQEHSSPPDTSGMKK
jgi:hypothetical protein